MVAKFHYEAAKKLAPTIVNLWKTDRSGSARSLCERKILEFEKLGYSSSTIKSLISVYRDAIRRELRDRGIYQKDGRLWYSTIAACEEEPLSNYSYKLQPLSLFGGSYRVADGRLKHSVARKHVDSFNDDGRDRVDAKNWSRIPITSATAQALLKTAKADLEAITSDHHNCPLQGIYNAVIALVLVTGRRPYREMMVDAEFSIRSEDNRLDFSGQSKGDQEKRDQVYQVNVIGVDRQLVVDAFDIVRSRLDSGRIMARFQEMIGDSESSELLAFQYLRDATKSQLQTACSRYLPAFEEQFAKGWGPSFGNLHPHDFRGLYGHILKLEYEKKQGYTVDEDQFLARVLFHETKRSTGEVRADSMTAKSYKRFEFRDSIDQYKIPEKTSEIII